MTGSAGLGAPGTAHPQPPRSRPPPPPTPPSGTNPGGGAQTSVPPASSHVKPAGQSAAVVQTAVQNEMSPRIAQMREMFASEYRAAGGPAFT